MSTRSAPARTQAAASSPTASAFRRMRERRLAGAAVHVRPGGGVDHDLRRVAPNEAGRRRRLVEVVVRAAPGERPEGARERRLLEGGHQGAAEAAAGSRDRDPHQPARPLAAGRGRRASGPAGRSSVRLRRDDVARRSAYWRA